MNLNTRAVFVALLVCSPATAAWSQEAAGGDERPWTNTAELSAVQTSGNSNVTTLALSDKFAYAWPNSRFTLEFSALKTRTTERSLSNVAGEVQVEERTRTTGEEYTVQGQYRRSLYESLFAFAAAGWSRNEFAGIDSRYSGAIGLGYQIIDTERSSLAAQLGADLTRENPVTGDTEEFPGAQLRVEYGQRLTESAIWESSLEALENLDDTDDFRLNLLTSITTSVSEVFAVKLSYLVRFDNQPVRSLVPGDEPGEPDASFEFDETDTRFAASLVVNI